MTRPHQPRIDLNHGFLRFIRRNQVDRDEYNRVHEERKSEIRERIGSSDSSQDGEEKAQSNVYVPPHLRRQKKENEEKFSALKASRSQSQSDTGSEEGEGASGGGEASCPIQQKQKAFDENVRRQVRRRIERTHPTVDDICIVLANYSLQEAASKNSENSNEDLFELVLTLKSGEQKTIGVPRNTQAARLAKSLSREHHFSDSQCRNLRIFIEEQLELRFAREKSTATSSDASIPGSPTSSSESSIIEFSA